MTFGAVAGILSILISLLSIGITFRGNRRMKLFRKHIIVARQHLHNSVQAIRDGNDLEADLHLAAANEELERAQYYS